MTDTPNMTPDMQPVMAPGLHLNPDVLQATLQSQLAEYAVNNAQLTSACQQLIMEKAALQQQLDDALLKLAEKTEDADGDESEETVKAKRAKAKPKE